MDDLKTDTLLAQTTEIKGYKILPPCVLYARIGAGGMGAVYRGHHLNLDIDVAVKCLKPSLAEDDPTFVDRFKREARSAAKINHQNVIRVFDVAEDCGLHYLIMEFVAGETARQRVARKGQLKVPEALQIVYEAALGLGEAHRMGIIHRDVKPDNLLISSRGQVKVADLGLAKPAVSSGQSILSMAGQVMGTPSYMPPEQWGEGQVTSASDVWAMGAVLYYLLSGKEAISGESVAAIMSKIVLHEFPDLRTIRSDIPDSVIALLHKATAKAPGDRYVDAYELANAIGQLPEHRISLADTEAGSIELVTMLSPPPNARINEIKQLLATGTPEIDDAAQPKDPAEPSPPTSKRPSRIWAAALVGLLLAAGGSAGYVYRDVLFGSKPIQPVIDKLAQTKSLRNEGKYVAALRAARAAFTADPQLMDQELVTDLRKEATTELRGCLEKSEPNAAVAKGQEVTFAGRFTTGGGDIEELLLGDTPLALTNGTFEARLLPPTDGKLALRARVTAEDTLDLGEWRVAFKAEDPDVDVEPIEAAPITFQNQLATEEELGSKNTIDAMRVTLIGKATEKDAALLLGGRLLDNVQWQEDGTFRVEVALPDEGRNTIVLSVRRTDEPIVQTSPEQTRSIEIVRLTEEPTITLLSPSRADSATKATELQLEVQADEWTESVTATSDGEEVTLTKVRGDTWRTRKTLPLADGDNTIEIRATNLVGKEKKQPLKIQCTAKQLTIDKITLSVGETKSEVQSGGAYYVNRSPKLATTISEPGASLFVDGKPAESPFTPSLKAGSNTYRLRAKRQRRQSKEKTLTIVYDTEKPTIKFETIPRAQPDTEVTIRGNWSDNHGLASLKSNGEEVKWSKTSKDSSAATSGAWSVPVRVGKTRYDFTLTAIDLAGNKYNVKKTIDLVEAKSIKPVGLAPEPDPKPSAKPKPLVKLSRKIDARLFTPVGKLNQSGFPPELRHKETGIELVAINFVDTMAPALYVAKTVVTNKQWDGSEDNEAKTSVTWLEVDKQVKSARFAGLNMLTKKQWARVTSARSSGLIRTYNEWLQYDPADGFTKRPIAERGRIALRAPNYSNAYVGFRVGFSPM